ncbi:hypothetical protein SAMN05421594_0559 [Chryseobacterium oleae]|uniref:Uncharacterized protein n=1 Tax=Chryseobacterium oleae TaxID=491207 RepID=A0A1I4VS66_CHROL|nr:hypothetical protein [Chryseobacterium oleae]SFN03899.1 hypothetical protein SAMN05421594_0559 [Chryseobacterium oleae]
MRTFVIIDFYIQLIMLMTGMILASFGGYNFLLFYYVTGSAQLISFLIRLFLPIKKSVFYIIYGILIIPVWVSILLKYASVANYDISQILMSVLFASLFYSPVMAVIYIYDYYRVYESYP